VTSGNRGQSVGVTRIALDGTRIDRITGDEVVLTRTFAEHKATSELVEEFHRNLNALMKERALSEVRASLPEGGHYYIGASRCASCHKREYDLWLETPHSDAFQTLQKAGMEALPECYQCHVTGFGDPAGYHPEGGEIDLVNVQCEVCHDKGSQHARDGSYGMSLLMSGCLRCHDSGNSPEFDPEVYWKMIEH
jgi:hypothetical protein